MCKKGGFRCASHLSAKIKSLEAVEEKSVDEEAQLREMKYAYYGTRTGQKELDKSIEKAEDNGKDDTAERLKKTKMIASMLREEEAKQHQEKAEAEEADNRAKEAQKSMKDDDDVASVLPLTLTWTKLSQQVLMSNMRKRWKSIKIKGRSSKDSMLLKCVENMIEK